MNTYPEQPPADLVCECGRHLPCRHCSPDREGLGASPWSLSVDDAEALMCVAMLGSPMDHWLPILKRYNRYKENPIESLRAIGRNPSANAKADTSK